LDMKYVDDCKLNRVEKITLQANSCDVNIISLEDEAFLTGSFGNLFINKIASDFGSLDIVLENTDAFINLPEAAFKFYYNGKRSRLSAPSEINFTSKKKGEVRSLLKGFYKNESSPNTITINATYSKVNMQ